MEVHHHTHTERKKWHHYFWEFFMLFLAVTLGFFVENQREHYVEHLREKQYMRSMIEDLKSDTTEIRKILSSVDASRRNIDSMLIVLTAYNISDEAIIKSYQYTFPALNNIPVTFNDRTVTQLKNSDNMRIIHNQKVNDGIINYWNQIEVISKTLDRHMDYRTKGRDMETCIFNIAEIFLTTNGHVANPPDQVRLIDFDKSLVKEYANVVAYCGVMLGALRNQVTEQDRLANELIQLIKKEYHLE